MYLKVIDRILWLTYGNHGSSKEKREKAEVVLEALSNKPDVRRSELMRQIGLDEDVDEDVSEFNSIVRPLKGRNSSNPLNIGFVAVDKRDSDVYYWLSKPAFDISFYGVKKDVLYFFDRMYGAQLSDSEVFDRLKVMDQVIWLAYANHSNTYQHRQMAYKVLKHLVENGETGKQELMEVAGLEYGDENDDQRFRGMMQYLRASWMDEDEALNPLHSDSHGFLVSQSMEGQKAYYKINTREFRSTMNVVAGNIRSFVG